MYVPFNFTYLFFISKKNRTKKLIKQFYFKKQHKTTFKKQLKNDWWTGIY